MPERILIVFAPLIILIEEIAKSLGSEAVYLHTENRAPTLFAEIKALKYKVIVLSPEMAASNAFRDVFKEPAFQARLGAIIFDECQTLKDWAVDTASRRGLKDVSVIRHLAEVPGVAMSGTLPAAYRKEVLTYFELDDPVIVDVGVDRPNIKVTIAPIRQTISSYLDLLCWLPELHVAVPETDAEKKACEDACWPTIIYVNNKTQQLDIYYAVHSWYSRLGMMHAVLLVSAEMSTSHRRRVKELVEKGGIKCVVSTSALGMGSDMPVISRVIQWRIADSLAAIMQRIGRAGRDPSKLANGVILVDPWAVPSGAGGPASGGVTEESLAAALLAAEAGGRDDLDDIEDTNEPGSGETDEDFAKAVSESKSSKKFKVDIELMKVVHRALTKSGCVRALINQYLGQPPADKTPAPEDIFGAKLVTTRPCCCVCDPEPLPDPPEYAMPSKSTESRARAGITKLHEWVEPKLREWRVRKWTTEWSKDETAPTWRGLSYFFGVDDLAAVLKNLGKIDKAIVSNSDPMIVSYLQAEMKAVTGPQVLEYLKTEIAAHDAKLEEDRRSERRATDRRQDDRALQRALDKAKRKETTAIAQHAEGSIVSPLSPSSLPGRLVPGSLIHSLVDICCRDE
ncbi:hypothetical protein V8E36_008664 [Tilletia maclaganii]